jgi:hypothetical protein
MELPVNEDEQLSAGASCAAERARESRRSSQVDMRMSPRQVRVGGGQIHGRRRAGLHADGTEQLSDALVTVEEVHRDHYVLERARRVLDDHRAGEESVPTGRDAQSDWLRAVLANRLRSHLSQHA